MAKDTYGGNKSNVNNTAEKGGSLQEGLSSQQKCPKGYVPRTSAENGAVNPPKAEKVGDGFTIK